MYTMKAEGHSFDWLLAQIESPQGRLFYESAMEHVEYLRGNSRYGNANTYKNAINHLSRMYPGSSILDVTPEKAKSFIDFKKESLSNNGVRHYVKVLRALFNIFISKHFIKTNPFIQEGLMPPYTVTRKRNVSKEQVRLIVGCENFYTDLFYLMFLLRGMDLADLCSIENRNIEDGYIYYYRDKLEAKTNELQVKILDPAKNLLDKYGGNRMLLDVLKEPKDASEVSYRQYRTFLKNVNTGLDIATPIIGKKISCKFARHTFANIGKQMGYSKDLIGEMLGHSGGTITDVYQSRYDQHIIDEAHEKIVYL